MSTLDESGNIHNLEVGRDMLGGFVLSIKPFGAGVSKSNTVEGVVIKTNISTVFNGKKAQILTYRATEGSMVQNYSGVNHVNKTINICNNWHQSNIQGSFRQEQSYRKELEGEIWIDQLSERRKGVQSYHWRMMIFQHWEVLNRIRNLKRRQEQQHYDIYSTIRQCGVKPSNQQYQPKLVRLILEKNVSAKAYLKIVSRTTKENLLNNSSLLLWTHSKTVKIMVKLRFRRKLL